MIDLPNDHDRLVFDAASHTYTLDGERLPHVTSILRRVLGDPTGGHATQYHLDRGNAAHALYAILGRGDDLGLYEYDPRLDGHVRCWREWAAAEAVTFHGVEMPVASERWRYAGTLDALAESPKWPRGAWIVDYKQSTSKRDRIQLAAYAIALMESHGILAKGVVGVQIDGERWRYGDRFTGLPLRSAMAEWHADLAVYRQLEEGV
jgi:hypothetical protein